MLHLSQHRLHQACHRPSILSQDKIRIVPPRVTLAAAEAYQGADACIIFLPWVEMHLRQAFHYVVRSMPRTLIQAGVTTPTLLVHRRKKFSTTTTDPADYLFVEVTDLRRTFCTTPSSSQRRRSTGNRDFCTPSTPGAKAKGQAHHHPTTALLTTAIKEDLIFISTIQTR